jgi:predicted HTH domain antitoxin
MNIEIAEAQLKSSGLNEAALKLELAIFLFEKNIFTLGNAAEFCSLHKMEMQRVLADRNIPLHYTIEMLHQDLETNKKFK